MGNFYEPGAVSVAQSPFPASAAEERAKQNDKKIVTIGQKPVQR
jgi:hypothetical protein